MILVLWTVRGTHSWGWKLEVESCWKLEVVEMVRYGALRWKQPQFSLYSTSWTDEMHNICTYYFPSVWLRISSSFQVSGENWRDE